MSRNNRRRSSSGGHPLNRDDDEGYGGPIRRGRRERGSPYSRPSRADGEWGHDAYERSSGGRRPQSGKIAVTNLAEDVGDEDLRDIFSGYGTLVSAEVNYDRNGNSKGTAEVEFKTASAARDAIKDLNEASIDGKEMRLTLVGATGGSGHRIIIKKAPVQVYEQGYDNYRYNNRRGGGRNSNNNNRGRQSNNRNNNNRNNNRNNNNRNNNNRNNNNRNNQNRKKASNKNNKPRKQRQKRQSQPQKSAAELDAEMDAYMNANKSASEPAAESAPAAASAPATDASATEE